MILFKDIYARAINLFDDPDIDRAYVQNTIKFEKMMYRHLQDGVQLFKNPTKITWELIDQTDPQGQMEIFTGDEVQNDQVVLSSTPTENSEVVVMINGEVDSAASYDAATKTVTLSKETTSTDEISVEWYFGGQFNSDFSAAATPQVPLSVIVAKVVDILARALVVAWAEKNKNFILEIRNVLTDTDFKLYSPANSTQSKIAWVQDLRKDLDTMQTKLGWDLYSVSRRAGGYYGS